MHADRSLRMAKAARYRVSHGQRFSKHAQAICTNPLAREVMPLWHLERVLGTEGVVHDTTTPTHAGGYPPTQLLRTTVRRYTEVVAEFVMGDN